ncbi:MAG: glycosyltransferase, partial [Bacteroidales bacterium]
MLRKRVLIITYYWPPSGGIGVHRCLKFAKYLRDFGWEPVIFTAKDAQYPVIDESNFKHVPENLEVHSIPIFEPFSLFKKMSGRKPEDSPNPVYVRDKKRSWIDEFSIWIRGNFFIPDARACWIRPAVRTISRFIKSQGNIDAIFSDGPPHTNTRIAYHLAKKFNIPWVADFQDPWTQVDYYKLLKITPIADRIHSRMEQGVFRQANRITIASPSWAKDLEKIGARDVKVLYYGYDKEDFTGNELSKEQQEKLI